MIPTATLTTLLLGLYLGAGIVWALWPTINGVRNSFDWYAPQIEQPAKPGKHK